MYPYYKEGHTTHRISLIFCIVLLLGIFPSAVWAVDYTVRTVPNVRLSDGNNHVTNPDQIISAADVARINTLLTGLEESMGIEVVVVALHSIGYNDSKEFATGLFEHWGIGKKEDDNGLLIQLVTEPIQRSVVFETGYGLEGILSDAVCYRLQQDYMLPDLKDGNYSSGMVKGVEAVVGYLMASDYERKDFMSDSSVSSSSWTGEDTAAMVEVILLFLFSFYCFYRAIKIIRNKNKCPKCAKKTFLLQRAETLAVATYTSTGLVKNTSRCSTCGHVEEKTTVTPMLTRVRSTRTYHSRSYRSGSGRSYSSGSSRSYSSGRSSTSSRSSSSSSRSSSSGRSSGRSYGGGRSGGGGARSKF